MAKDYGKVYAGFFEGSLRDQPPFARLLFMAMCFKADENGVALGTVGFWADYVKITEEEVREALVILSSPDPDSTSPELDGRRIESWGDGCNRWRVVNYGTYHARDKAEDRKVYKAEWIKKKRAGDKATTGESLQKEPDLSTVDKVDKVDPNEIKEKEIYKEKKSRPTLAQVCVYMAGRGLPESEAARFVNYHDSKGWVVGRSPMKDWQAAVRTWEGNYRKDEPGPDVIKRNNPNKGGQQH